MTGFAGKRVILTGASQGIGGQLALQLAKEGAQLALMARSRDKLAAVASACEELGAKVLMLPVDVTDTPALQVAVQTVRENWDGIDALVLNAGVVMYALFEEIEDPGFFRNLIEVNYLANVNLIHQTLPDLRKSKGQIVAVSSLAGKACAPYHSGYAASKHALHGFLNSLRAEILGSGVDITIVCPGFVATEIRTHGYSAQGNRHIRDPFAPREMSPARCALLILKAARRRERERVLTASGYWGTKILPFFPSLIDRIARKMCGL